MAAVARSIAEGALLAAVAGLLLVHASGAFRTPAPGSFGSAIEAWSLYRSLHETLLALAGAGEAVSNPAAALLVLVPLLAASVLIAPRVVKSLASMRYR